MPFRHRLGSGVRTGAVGAAWATGGMRSVNEGLRWAVADFHLPLKGFMYSLQNTCTVRREDANCQHKLQSLIVLWNTVHAA